MKQILALLLLLALPVCLTWPPVSDAIVNEDNGADRYTANGSTADFSYNFKIYTTADIEVLVNSTVKTLTTHYTVSGTGASFGGTVTFLTAPVNGAIVTLLRKQPASQLSNYIPNEAFPSIRIMKDLDKLVMQVQQLKEEVDRALKFAKSSALVDEVVDAPTVGSFARGKVGGGVDWATPTNAGALSSPVAVNNGGTGSTTAAGAAINLAMLPLAGGNLTGALTSSFACATGYTRITPVFCKAILPIVTTYTPNAGCTGHTVDANLPTNKVVMFNANWVTFSNNATGTRTANTNIYGSSNTCATIIASTSHATWEQAAVTAGMAISVARELFLSTTLAGTLYTIDANAGGNGTSQIVSLNVLGYFDN